ncbi:MAG: chorismate mutase [Candidatus Cyclobacteriaceae bacterium M2_1C_046]
MEDFIRLFNKKPFIIAGPCSAESPEQLENTVSGIVAAGVNVIRAGVWKPRSRPNAFEGAGVDALQWLKDCKEKYKVKTAVEVANPEHVEAALRYDMDILWIGARTTVNPFAVQEIAQALKGVNNKIILLKNPINPDLPLWIGGIERVLAAGIKSVGAIHRGFSSFQPGKFRNSPVWQIPIEFKRQLPHVPLFCDPSHIAGNRKMIAEVSQTAVDFSYDGLIIEVHNDPDNALSDANQQITPEVFAQIINNLKIRSATTDDSRFSNKLHDLRDQIDEIDRELVEIIARRMNVVDEIAKYKKKKNISVFQLERWKEIISTRPDWAKKMGVNENLIEDIYKAIHTESMKRQTESFNKEEDE